VRDENVNLEIAVEIAKFLSYFSYIYDKMKMMHCYAIYVSLRSARGMAIQQ
jgi:hypothetical protein